MIALLILLVIINAAASDRRSGRYAIDGGPDVQWTIDQSKFEATLTSKQPVAWMSLGISPNNGKMKGSDAFIAAGKAIYRVQLGPSGDESGAFQNIAENYADGSIVQSGSNMIFNVRRPLDMDQPWQVAIDQAKAVNLIVSWRDDPSPSGLLGIHSGHHSRIINNETAALTREEAKVLRSDLYKQIRCPNTGLLVSYSISDDRISFDIEANSESWIGFGISKRPSMHPSVAVIGQSPNQVQAYVITSDDAGAADPQVTSELSNTNFQSGNGKSRLQFTRPLRWATSRISDGYNIEPNGKSIVIAATGKSATLAIHTRNDVLEVSWGSASTSSKGSSMRAFVITHGVFMIIAWLILMPIGGIVARYFKDSEFRWILVHKAVMLSVVAVTIISFTLIVSVQGRPFDTTHGTIGVFVLVLVLLQPLLAMFRNKARAIWRLQHRSTSAILYLAALVNCYLGALMLYSLSTLFITFITILLIVALVSVVLLEMKRGRASHQAESDIREEDNNRATGFR